MIKTLELSLSAADFSWARLSDEEKGRVKVLYKKVCEMIDQGNRLRDADDGVPLPGHLQPPVAYKNLSLKPGLVEFVAGRTLDFNAKHADAGYIRMLLKAYNI